jgi:hypothetical protein
MVFMVLLDSLTSIGLHNFLLYLWQWVCNDSVNQYSNGGYVMFCNFNSYCYSCECWVCWCFLGTSFWKCNHVFYPGDCGFSKLLCTTDERIASCAGHHFVVWSYGWLCTTGTDSLFCAGNLLKPQSPG